MAVSNGCGVTRVLRRAARRSPRRNAGFQAVGSSSMATRNWVLRLSPPGLDASGKAVMTKRWIVPASACTAMLYAAIAHVAAAPEQQPARPAAAVSPQRALIDRYCATCHSDRLRTGGLSLSASEVDPLQVGDDVETWEKVVRKLRARAMPPAGPGRPRPDEQSYAALVSHLETALDRVAAERLDPGPAERFRRLTRATYQNAVRDLLDLEVDAASLLPRRRLEPRVRQRQCRRCLADAARSLPRRSPEGEPAGGRPRGFARCAHRGAAAGPDARRSV